MEPPTSFMTKKINPFLLTVNNEKMEAAIRGILQGNNRPLLYEAVLELLPPRGARYTLYIMSTADGHAFCSIQMGSHTVERYIQAHINLEAQIAALFNPSRQLFLVQDRNSILNSGGVNNYYREHRPLVFRILVPAIFNPANVIKNVILDMLNLRGRRHEHWPALNLPLLRQVFQQAVRRIANDENENARHVMNVNFLDYINHLHHTIEYRDAYIEQLDNDEQEVLELEREEIAIAEANGLIFELDF